jgi:hypothetical protein
MTEYIYNISSDFPNGLVNIDTFTEEIEGSSITKILDYILVGGGDCKTYFTESLSGGEETTLSGLVGSHHGHPPIVITPPAMDDGRPIVRADTRPLDCQTYFTMAGDTASGIGDGTVLKWDFSNDDDISELDYCPTPSGFKTKHIEMTFIDPLYLKDGSLYFFDAPWGSHCGMHVVVPAGNYYPNDHGSIPASALGLSGTDMYSYASVDTLFINYVNQHHMYGSCPMGDEMNAEGAAVEAIPVGWKLVGHITTLSGDNTSKGFASFECYRCRTVLLEGDTV